MVGIPIKFVSVPLRGKGSGKYEEWEEDGSPAADRFRPLAG